MCVRWGRRETTGAMGVLGVGVVLVGSEGILVPSPQCHHEGKTLRLEQSYVQDSDGGGELGAVF